MKRKYGAMVAGVIEFGANAGKKLEQLEQRDAELGRINESMRKTESELWRAGADLSARRQKVIPKLTKAVVAELKDLGYARSHFEVGMTTVDKNSLAGSDRAFSMAGLDTLEFLFSPNV